MCQLKTGNLKSNQTKLEWIDCYSSSLQKNYHHNTQRMTDGFLDKVVHLHNSLSQKLLLYLM